MPLYAPPSSGFAFLDLRPEFPGGVRLDSELADAYTLEQLGIRSDTETSVSINRGEILTTQEGQYVQSQEQIVTPTETITVDITRLDIGAGETALKTVKLDDGTKERDRSSRGVDASIEKALSDYFDYVNAPSETQPYQDYVNQPETETYIQPQETWQPQETQEPTPEPVYEEPSGPDQSYYEQFEETPFHGTGGPDYYY